MELPLSHFSDYRAFLVAYAQLRKEKNPRWSYGAWARALELQGASSLTKIVQGKRNPGELITRRLIGYFRFNAADAGYFRDLIQLHKHRRDPRLTVLLLESLQKKHPNHSIRILDEPTFSAIANWYFYAIREMVLLDVFFDDPKWIAKRLRFPVSPSKITHAMATLVELGLLRRNSRGALEISENQIDTSSDFASEALKRHHEQMLDKAKLALRQVDPAQREFTSTTFVTSRENLMEAKNYLRQCRKRFVSLFEKPGGDAVYQVQIAFFPLTRGESNKKRGKK